MESDVPLPSPPRRQQRAVLTSLPQNAPRAPVPVPHRPGKLKLGSLPGTPSSDPPLFSSDDFQSSALENYMPKTTSNMEGDVVRKRRYRGTWWGMETHAKRKRTDFKEKRNMDSGVWMPSDDSTDSCWSLSSEEPVAQGSPNIAHHTIERGLPGYTHGGASNSVFPSQKRHLPQQQPEVSTQSTNEPELEAHRQARAAVATCLEEGDDNVDLSHLNLPSIPSGLLRPLVQLTKQPPVKEAPISDEVYEPLEPFLRLFLSKNLLRILPAEVFDLQGLKILSLRHNKLTEIPSAIRKLTMLQNLNVAANKLRHLPWELLGLMQKGDLQQLTVHPNDFISLEEADVAQWHCTNENGKLIYKDVFKTTETFGHDSLQAKAPVLVATGKVRFFDMEGRALESSPLLSNHGPSSSHNSRVPSLRELALQSCNRSHQLSRYLESDLLDAPDLVLRLLNEAREVRDVGGRCCSVCFRSFVIPRTEWVEWWDCMPHENGSKSPRKDGQLYPLPFLRRGCSWSCVPGTSSSA